MIYYVYKVYFSTVSFKNDELLLFWLFFFKFLCVENEKVKNIYFFKNMICTLFMNYFQPSNVLNPRSAKTTFYSKYRP